MHAADQPLRVFACEPEWAALVTELGGKHVEVFSATTARQDPHRIEARPSLIAQASQADLLVCTGAGLEVGWLPLLLRQAANPVIADGQKGNFAAANYVLLKEVPGLIDRSLGDIHAEGNPHLQLDPANILAIAQPLMQRLAEIDTVHAPAYQSRYQDFSRRWAQAMQGWQQSLAPLAQAPVVVQHRNWTYLLDWGKLQEAVALEPMPGLPPSITHLQKVLQLLQHRPARFVIRAVYEDPKPSAWISERTKIPLVVLSQSPDWQGGQTLFQWFDDITRALLQR
jgi:zinc/manganese transport system substrate-binding protein